MPEWTNIGQRRQQDDGWIDGFPVITNWDDPIQYSCQKNFMLGIGDINTHADRNVPGSTSGSSEPSKPAEVTADTTVNAVTATNKVGSLQGMGGSLGDHGGCCTTTAATSWPAWPMTPTPRTSARDSAASPNTIGKQTVQTYWLDVLEFGTYSQQQPVLPRRQVRWLQGARGLRLRRRTE